MNCDKESTSEELFLGRGWEWGGGGGGLSDSTTTKKKKKKKKKNTCIRLFFVLMLYRKFQAPSSSGSLDLTQIKSTEICKRSCRDKVYC